MSTPSSLPKPFAGALVAGLDAVAIAIAETDIELSSQHALFRRSDVPAKRLAPVLSHPEALMQAVAEVVLGLRVAGRCRDSKPLDCHTSRSRNSEVVAIRKG